MVLRALEEHCPLARPSRFARQAWSRECSILVRAHRAARRRYTSGHGLEDEAQYKDLHNQLKNQLRKESTKAWRGFVEDYTQGAGWHKGSPAKEGL